MRGSHLRGPARRVASSRPDTGATGGSTRPHPARMTFAPIERGGTGGSSRRSPTRSAPMRALRMVDWNHDPEFAELPEPEAGPGEVVITVGGAGVCHSDLHLLYEFPAGAMPWDLPMTLGHENAGWVHQLGPGVRGLEVGQPVAVYGPWGCGVCHACATWAGELLPERRARDPGRRPRRQWRHGRVHDRPGHPSPDPPPRSTRSRGGGPADRRRPHAVSRGEPGPAPPGAGEHGGRGRRRRAGSPRPADPAGHH